VPTFEEAGLPGYEAVGWFGTVAPAGTPTEVISKLNSEIRAALSVPEIRERALAAGAEPLANSPQEFAAFIRAETKKWAEVIKAAGVKLE
jgi:tripartite-type tricarboxylate transporter receptor subunit TctC